MKTKMVIIGLLSGVVAGLIVGMLYAPDKGSSTRRLIADKSGELSDGIKHRFHQFGEFISEKLDSTKGVYSHFIRVGRTDV